MQYMAEPETDPAYLATVIDAVVAAVAEASAVLSAGNVSEVREILRYANDLLDLLTDGVHDSAQALAYVEKLRNTLSTMYAQSHAASALH